MNKKLGYYLVGAMLAFSALLVGCDSATATDISSSSSSSRSSSSVSGDNANSDNPDEIVQTLDYDKGITTDIVSSVEDYEFSGIAHISNFVFRDEENDFSIDEMSFKYKLSSFFGEPTESGIFMWSGNSGSSEIYTIKIRLKVYNSNDEFTGMYYTYSPLVESTDGEWSWDVSGSPNWNEFWYTDAALTEFAAKTDVVALYKSGFYLADPTIMQINSVELP